MKPEDFGITNYSISSDGKLNVNNSVNLSNFKLTEIPFEFGYVKGDFNVSHNQLNSLKNCPKYIKGFFSANNNKLTQIDYFPENGFDDVSFSHNQLQSFDGLPETMSWGKKNDQQGYLDLSNNPFQNLEWLPNFLSKVHINLKNCNLANLKGIKVYDKISLDVGKNKLTSFEGLNGQHLSSFYCGSNQIESWEGAPKSIVRIFYACDNRLTDLSGVPEGATSLDLQNNLIEKIEFNEYWTNRTIFGKDNLRLEFLGNPLIDISQLERFKKYVTDYHKLKIAVDNQIKSNYIRDNLK